MVRLSASSFPMPELTLYTERVKLLIHLLRCQFKVFKHANFSLETLRQSIEGIMKGRPHWKRGYLAMLEEVYSVREREMRYERGEIGDFHSLLVALLLFC